MHFTTVSLLAASLPRPLFGQNRTDIVVHNKVAIELVFAEDGDAPREYLLDLRSHVHIKLGEGLRWSGPGVVEISADLRTAAITIRSKSID
jgi:hypothetical protein